MNPLLIATLPFLADNNNTAPTEADMRPGAWAFVIVATLLLVTVLLWFSLRKQLNRIEVPYADEGEGSAALQDDSSGDGAGEGGPQGRDDD